MEENIYSEIKTVTLKRFKVARYVIISPNPEQNVIAYMDSWAKKSGLLDFPNYKAKRIGWDFPFVTKEQQDMFGLRGYVVAYILPEEFEPKCCGAEIAYIEEDTYATLTIKDPHSDSFKTIPKAFQMLIDFAQTKTWENRIAFEEEYEKDGINYMDVFVPVK